MSATTRMIVTHGLSAPTAVIAQEAGVSNGSLFTCFKTKADLFNQLYHELKAGMASAVLEGLPTSDRTGRIKSQQNPDAACFLGLCQVPFRHTVFSMMKARHYMRRIVWGVLAVTIILAALSGTIMSQVAQPKFKTIAAQGKFEIREYAPLIVAEVEVSGEREKAINEGFRLIAGYIFGGNLATNKIAMTAPVSQQRSEKMAVTAPVTQQAGGGVWKVRFVMPDSYSLDTLPKPNNDRVKLIPVPSKRFVVIRFSGSQTDRNMKPYEKQLLNYVVERKLTSVGEPIFAFYNPPWTLPFLKHNEVMIELK